jgi:hypothetical protein
MAQTRYPACSPAVRAVDVLVFSGMYYYDNGAAKIGIHLEIGGAITNLVHAPSK